MDNSVYIEYFSDLLLEMEDVHTVMVEIPRFKQLMDYIASIPEEIIYEPTNPEYGKTKHPHVTVLYGIDTMEEEKAKALLRKIPGQITATLGAITKFETPEFDVLKIDVASPYLTRINKFLRDTVEYHNDYPSYKPHVTLCYLKKGAGAEFTNDNRFVGMKFAFKTFLYSNETRQKESIPMKVPEKSVTEYGAGGGYGGAAGGSIAATGWSATPSSPQSIHRLANYGTKSNYRDKPGSANLIQGIDPYDTINDEDLQDPRFSPDEIRAGLRYEMPKMDFPDKEAARKVVIKNLTTQPKYYSDLHQYFDSQK